MVLAKIAINIATIENTEYSPFYLNFGYHPTFWWNLPEKEEPGPEPSKAPVLEGADVVLGRAAAEISPVPPPEQRTSGADKSDFEAGFSDPAIGEAWLQMDRPNGAGGDRDQQRTHREYRVLSVLPQFRVPSNFLVGPPGKS